MSCKSSHGGRRIRYTGGSRRPHHPNTRVNDIEKIRIGISSCLVGQEVRYDGGHKRDAYINGTLSQYFEFVPVCPEVAIGLGVPRPPIRLVQVEQAVRVLGVDDPSCDVTTPLTDYGREMAAGLADISGYLFKRASPSCGMERVKVYSPDGVLLGKGRGAYARAFMESRPCLPCEEEGRLGDAVLRENFIERVFVYQRWQSLCARGLTPGGLVDFHTRHKYAVMAHSQAAYRNLGRLVAGAGNGDLDALAQEYISELMSALRRPATRKRHVNVLQHLFGYVSDALDRDDRAEMVELLEQYRTGLVPLIVPITLLKHHFRRHPQPYIEQQVYLSPHPAELMLRNAL